MGEELISHWDRHAQQWSLVGPPLRPDANDTDCFTGIIGEWSVGREREPLVALLLGVTPEIARLDWPEHTRLIAADYSEQMIRSLWPLRGRQDRLAFCSDWYTLPLADSAAGIVIGDGCFTTLPYPDGYRHLLREIQRVLLADGLLIMRFFISTGDPSSPEQVHEQLLTGSIGNFHTFKFRLAIALQHSAVDGVCLGDVWENWNAQGYDIDRLAAHLGWQPDVMRTIDAYRGVNTRYTYPTLEELEAVFTPWFDRIAQYNHDYEFGENCPTLVLRASDT